MDIPRCDDSGAVVDTEHRGRQVLSRLGFRAMWLRIFV